MGTFIYSNNWGTSEARKSRVKLIIKGTYVQHGTYTIYYLTDWRHEHTYAHTQNNRTKWSLLRPISDLSASCGLQGPGPRGRTGPPARSRRSRCPHDRAPGERNSAGKRLAGEDPPLHRPLRAQTLSHSTTLRADVHLLPSRPPLLFVLRRERPFVRAHVRARTSLYRKSERHIC